MEQAVFKQSFPAFPIYDEAIDKLKLMLVEDGISTEEELDSLWKLHGKLTSSEICLLNLLMKN